MATAIVQGKPEKYPSGSAAKWTVALALTATFVANADVNMVIIAAPVMQRQLHANVGDLELMVAGYQIAYAAILVTGGRLADVFGCRRVFIGAFGAFVLTSTACGLATSAGEMIAFRMLQGASAGLLAPQVVTIIQVVLPPAKRGGAFSALGAVISIASTIGPLLAGFLLWADVLRLTWRPIFLINVPIGVVAIILGTRLIPTLTGQRAKRLDLLGSVIIAALLVALMVPLSLGQLYGWPQWVWISLGAVPVLGALFIASQRWLERRGRDPLLPAMLWKDGAFRTGFVLYFTLFSGVTAFFLYYSMLIQSGYHATALFLSITIIPFGVAIGFFSIMSAGLIRRFEGWRVLTAGAVLCGLGFLSMLLPATQVTSGAVAAWMIPSQVVTGAGLGLVIAPLLGAVLAGIRSSEAGAASGLLSMAQVIGGALGVGFMGLLFQSSLPGGVAAATAAELRSGLARSLIFDPVVFAVSLVIIVTLLRPAKEAEDKSRSHAQIHQEEGDLDNVQ
jgi:MFS family permease